MGLRNKYRQYRIRTHERKAQEYAELLDTTKSSAPANDSAATLFKAQIEEVKALNKEVLRALELRKEKNVEACLTCSRCRPVVAPNTAATSDQGNTSTSSAFFDFDPQA